MEPEKKQGLKAGQRNGKGKLGMGTSTERKRMPGNMPEKKRRRMQLRTKRWKRKKQQWAAGQR